MNEPTIELKLGPDASELLREVMKLDGAPRCAEDVVENALLCFRHFCVPNTLTGRKRNEDYVVVSTTANNAFAVLHTDELLMVEMTARSGMSMVGLGPTHARLLRAQIDRYLEGKEDVP